MLARRPPPRRHAAAAAAAHTLPRPTRCQALALPPLEEDERSALSLLTSLTRLSFGARGKGAVGASLAPLARLQDLSIALCHRHEHFIVLHPAVDWASLRALPALARLRLQHLAAFTFLAAPEQVWSDEALISAQADALLAASASIQYVELRCAAGRWLSAAALRLG